jgi:hypothetical protein
LAGDGTFRSIHNLRAGYVGQEFIPKRPDALESLKQAVAL